MQIGQYGWVADHNYFRAMHGAAAVTWDADLATKAQTWADHLASQTSLAHSDTYAVWPPSGENLAYGMGTFDCKGVNGPYGQACAVWNWYNEYNTNWNCVGDWRSTSGVGHFTAVVWKGINIIGCGSSGAYFVCNYGHTDCKERDVDYGGSTCGTSMPAKLPNFNKDSC